MHDKDLQIALNAHRINKLRENWKGDLSKACGLPISDESFLGIEETVQLKKSFFDVVKKKHSTLSICWDCNEQNYLLDYLNLLETTIKYDRVILFHSQDEFFGAVQIAMAAVLRNPLAVWQVVKDDLALASDNISSGLCVEKGYYELDGKYVAEGVYELTAWGAFALRP